VTIDILAERRQRHVHAHPLNGRLLRARLAGLARSRLARFEQLP